MPFHPAVIVPVLLTVALVAVGSTENPALLTWIMPVLVMRLLVLRRSTPCDSPSMRPWLKNVKFELVNCAVSFVPSQTALSLPTEIFAPA